MLLWFQQHGKDIFINLDNVEFIYFESNTSFKLRYRNRSTINYFDEIDKPNMDFILLTLKNANKR